MHFALLTHINLANNRNVVLSLTSDNTGITAVTYVLVNGHTPGIAFTVIPRFVIQVLLLGRKNTGPQLLGVSLGCTMIIMMSITMLMGIRLGLLPCFILPQVFDSTTA